MQYGNIEAIGHVDLRYLQQGGKIVIETELAAASSLIAIGPGAAAALRPAGIVATNIIAIGAGSLALAGPNAARNIGIGRATLSSLVNPVGSGTDSIAIGDGALAATNVGGGFSVAIGTNALATGIGNNNNVAIGYSAGAVTTSSQLVIIGSNAALAATTIGSGTIIIGALAGRQLGGAPNNVVIGFKAWENNASSPGSCVVVGFEAAAGPGATGLCSATVAVGYRACYGLTSGQNNIGVGAEAATALTTGAQNTVLGRLAAPGLVNGVNNTLIGYGVAPTLASGHANVIIGSFEAGGGSNVPAGGSSYYIAISAHIFGGAAPSLVVADPVLRNLHFGPRRPGNWLTATGADNHAIGDRAMDVLTSGARNLAIGSDALGTLTTGNNNVALGHNALIGAAGSEAAGQNVAIGAFAMPSINAAAVGSVAVGYDVAALATSANNGVYIGRSAAPALTTGPFNILIGFGVANNLTTGRNNVVIGAYQGTALFARTSAVDSSGQIVIAAEADTESGVRQSLVVVALTSVYVGSAKPGNWLTSTGVSNVGIGDAALGSQTTGTLNVAVGAFAGGGVTTGSNNTLLGNNAGSSLTTGLRNILIGNAVGQPAVGTNDFLNIGKTIFADIAAGQVRIGGVETVTVAGQTERLAVTSTGADTVAPFSLETTGANGAKIFQFTGTRDPNGLVTGDPGDHYLRKNGTSSALYINTGAAAANTTWTLLGSSAAPTVQAQIPNENDDTADGFVIGSRVYSTAAAAWYTACSVTAGAAFWRRDSEQFSARNIVLWGPYFQGSNLISAFGSNGPQVDGTIDNPAPATTNLRTSLRRLISSGAAGFGGGFRGDPYYWRGNAAGLGGFYHHFVFAIATATANQRTAIGLVDANPGVFFDPNTFTNCFFVGNRAADANLQIMHNDNAGNVTAVDLGASFPAATTTAVYEAFFYAKPNDSAMYYLVRRLDTAAVAAGAVTTNMPVSTTYMLDVCYICEPTGAANFEIDLMKLYAECYGPQT